MSTVTAAGKRFVFISTAEWERQRRMRRARYRRYEGKHKDFRTADRHKDNVKHVNDYREVKMIDRPFIFWDGEGPRDTGYSLFGNSAGYEVCYPTLSTFDCLELITQTGRENPGAIHIAFGFNYDVSMMLKDLPRRSLRLLARTGHTLWKYWRLEWIPHKWFKVRYVTDTEKVTVKIYDIRTFFQGGYVSCLEKFGVGTDAERQRLAEGKAGRDSFLWSEIAEIRDYWRLELALGPKLGERLRESLAAAGYLPRSWHGPGALARMALARHHVYAAMAKCPAYVQHAARMAYAGGRFDPYILGEVNANVYEADINSAYPAYATRLPNLARGNWRHGREYEPDKFALYHIRYKCKPDSRMVHPLFRRSSDHMVRFPSRVESWFWGPEAELVKDDPAAKFIEALIFDEDDSADRPFAFLAEYYRRRQLLNANANIAAYAYKILINAIYGQLAQRAGWDRKHKRPPRSHQLEWAGYITSACRAEVYEAAVKCGDKLISINTDSVQALCPLDDIVDTGNDLGQWKTETYSGGLFFQAGIYSLRDMDGIWRKAKTRGIPKGQYTTDELRDAIRESKPLTLVRKMFYTFALADMGQWELLNTWNIEPHNYEFGGSRGSKRRHMRRPVSFPEFQRGDLSKGFRCGRPCQGLPEGMHRTFMIEPFPNPDRPYDIKSYPHYLPWLDGKDTIKDKIDGYMVEINELDPEDEWSFDDCAAV